MGVLAPPPPMGFPGVLQSSHPGASFATSLEVQKELVEGARFSSSMEVHSRQRMCYRVVIYVLVLVKRPRLLPVAGHGSSPWRQEMFVHVCAASSYSCSSILLEVELVLEGKLLKFLKLSHPF